MARDFERDPESIAFEAEYEYATLLKQEVRTTDSIEWGDVQGLDKMSMTRVRVNQHFFRSMILSGYRMRCAISVAFYFLVSCVAYRAVVDRQITSHEPT